MTLLEKAHRKFIQENLNACGVVNLDEFLEWYATNVHNAAISECIQIYHDNERQWTPETLEGFRDLKKENV